MHVDDDDFAVVEAFLDLDLEGLARALLETSARPVDPGAARAVASLWAHFTERVVGELEAECYSPHAAQLVALARAGLDLARAPTAWRARHAARRALAEETRRLLESPELGYRDDDLKRQLRAVASAELAVVVRLLVDADEDDLKDLAELSLWSVAGDEFDREEEESRQRLVAALVDTWQGAAIGLYRVPDGPVYERARPHIYRLAVELLRFDRLEMQLAALASEPERKRAPRPQGKQQRRWVRAAVDSAHAIADETEWILGPDYLRDWAPEVLTRNLCGDGGTIGYYSALLGRPVLDPLDLRALADILHFGREWRRLLDEDPHAVLTRHLPAAIAKHKTRLAEQRARASRGLDEYGGEFTRPKDLESWLEKLPPAKQLQIEAAAWREREARTQELSDEREWVPKDWAKLAIEAGCSELERAALLAPLEGKSDANLAEEKRKSVESIWQARARAKRAIKEFLDQKNKSRPPAG